MRNIRLSFMLFSTTLVFASCISDIEDEIEDAFEDGPGSVTATINGVDFASSGFLVEAKLNFSNDNNSFSLRIDAEEEKNGFDEDLDLNMFGGDFSLIMEGDSFTGDGNQGNPQDKIFTANYSKIGRTQGDETDIQTATDFISTDKCTITKLDRENRLVSGTFSYDAIDISNATAIYEVKNGIFTDLRY